jgi:hypothetical protein
MFRDGTAFLEEKNMSQAPWLFRQTDISRAFRAARAAGITARVDIAPDGTIRIFQLTPQEAGEAPKPAPNATPAAAGLRSWD